MSNPKSKSKIEAKAGEDIIKGTGPKRKRSEFWYGNRHIVMATMERGEMQIYINQIRFISNKNSGTARKPLTEIWIEPLDKSEGRIVLHVMEGPRKFLDRIDEIAG